MAAVLISTQAPQTTGTSSTVGSAPVSAATLAKAARAIERNDAVWTGGLAPRVWGDAFTIERQLEVPDRDGYTYAGIFPQKTQTDDPNGKKYFYADRRENGRSVGVAVVFYSAADQEICAAAYARRFDDPAACRRLLARLGIVAVHNAPKPLQPTARAEAQALFEGNFMHFKWSGTAPTGEFVEMPLSAKGMPRAAGNAYVAMVPYDNRARDPNQAAFIVVRSEGQDGVRYAEQRVLFGPRLG